MANNKTPARRDSGPPTVTPFVEPVYPPVTPDTTPGGTPYFLEPNQGAPHFDNPKNPRGVPSYYTTGAADAQATTDQKTQNPTPQRQPINATTFPDPSTNLERVSAGQNRKPPQEIVP